MPLYRKPKTCWTRTTKLWHRLAAWPTDRDTQAERAHMKHTQCLFSLQLRMQDVACVPISHTASHLAIQGWGTQAGAIPVYLTNKWHLAQGRTRLAAWAWWRFTRVPTIPRTASGRGAPYQLRVLLSSRIAAGASIRLASAIVDACQEVLRAARVRAGRPKQQSA